jgi:putative effector of murein hydrolase
MELLLTVAFWALFVYLIYKWAESKGRNATLWAVAAALISPVIVGIILLFVPKTIEKQAEEAKMMKKLMEE